MVDIHRSLLRSPKMFSLFIGVLLHLFTYGTLAEESCYVFGTQHILTFDGQRIDINSPCEFSLAYTCTPGANIPHHFDISIINIMQDDVSRTDCVKAVYLDHEVTLCANQTIMMNERRVDSLSTAQGQLVAYHGVTGVELSLGKGADIVIVSMTSTAAVRVTLPNMYAGRLCGICGNYDGNAANDLVTADNGDVSSQPAAERGAAIAGSYLIPSSAIECRRGGDVRPFMPSDCSEVGGGPSEHINDNDYCGAYVSGIFPDFQPCVDNQPQLAAMFESICRDDFCENYLTATVEDGELASSCFESGDCVYNSSRAKAAVNNVAEAFVDKCRSRGHDLVDWRAAYTAEISCPVEMSYTFNGAKCPEVCGLNTTRCSGTNREGCMCPPGHYRDGRQGCVTSASCGCVDPVDGAYHSVGDQWLDMTCSNSFSCLPSSVLQHSFVTCSQFASCSNTAGRYTCVCNAEYAGDGYICLRHCPAGQQPSANQQMCEDCPVGTYQPLANQQSCISCPIGEVTNTTGSTDLADCQAVTMLPDSQTDNGECVSDVFDRTYQTFVPTNILPDGLPFGFNLFTNFYTSTNGLISFGKPFAGRDPVGVRRLNRINVPLAAPFWYRQDLRHIRSEPAMAKLCTSSYNLVDADPERAAESRSTLSMIQTMLNSSSQLAGSSFVPTYAFVATWHKNVAFPFHWYGSHTSFYEHTTYQAVVATDGIRSFLMYIYPPGAQNLIPYKVNQFRQIYMGYNAQDSINSFTLYLSGTHQIQELQSEPSNTNVNGRWVFQVSDRGAPNPFAEACVSWYRETQLVLQSSTVNVDVSCPCNLQTAIRDERYLYAPGLACTVSLMRGATFHQMCCYDSATGALKTRPEEAGYPSLYLANVNPNFFETYDRRNYENCCVRSEHCDLFRELRPIPTCDGYRSPRVASGFGDPHLLTLDGHDYTYNPVGEFWMLNSTDLKMQARMGQSVGEDGNLIKATQFQAVAMQSSTSDRIHVQLNGNRTDFILYCNEKSLTSLVDSSVEDALVPFNGGILKKTNNSISVIFNNGYTFRFLIDLSILSVQSLVPPSAQGNTVGLLGVYDGDTGNDFTDRDGNIVCAPDACTSDDIHSKFGESWRITVDESIFWYQSRLWNTEFFTDRSFVPIYLNEGDVSNELLEQCNNDLACVYDIIATNSTELGLYTGRVHSEVNDQAHALENRPPYVSGPKSINGSINQMLTVTYTYGDPDNDTVHLVVTSLPDGASVVDSGRDWSMTWTPTSFDLVSLSMYAMENDSLNKEGVGSESLNVHLRISPECKNGSPGNHALLAPGGWISPLFYKTQCICDNGWEGEKCDEDIDGCADGPCYQSQCRDIPAPLENGTQYECLNATCDVGFVRTDASDLSQECFDDDECIASPPPCPVELCINTYGSYICNCPTGYMKSGEDCLDIDECAANTARCSDVCTNTNGSYECSCYPGAQLSADNFTCESLEMPSTLCAGLYNCSYACINDTDGKEMCTCARTKMLDPSDNTSCIALNECLHEELNGCDNSSGAQCIDLEVGYTCKCNSGYVLSDDMLSCEPCPGGKFGEDCSRSCHCSDRAVTCDNVLGCTECTPGWEGEQCLTNVDECSTSPCPPNALCGDLEGSYTCECLPGYRLTELANQTIVCEDINECEVQPCPSNAECTNTVGSYTCLCKAGFAGDGTSCTNINECATGDHKCVSDISRCQDEQPHYGCFCNLGYHGDGRIDGTGCSDDNECVDVVNACPVNHSICINTVPSYICVCEPFYTGDGSSLCVDINECAIGTAACGSLTNGNVTCVNEEPGYSCQRQCADGYELKEKDGGYTCEDVDECSDGTATCDPLDNGKVACINTEPGYNCQQQCDDGFMLVERGGRYMCEDVDECSDGTATCGSIVNGNVTCVNEEPGYSCQRQCADGYELKEKDGGYTCEDVDECSVSTTCPGGNVQCTNTAGSYECICEEYYTKNHSSQTCVDINECLLPHNCTFERGRCVNRERGYTCDCRVGYSEPDCTIDIQNTFITVDQLFNLTYNSQWNDANSPAYLNFVDELVKTATDLFNFPGLLGVNVLNVNQADGNSSSTAVQYQVVFSEKPFHLEHQTYYKLISIDYILKLNGENVLDMKSLQFDGYKWTCDNITCANDFSCSQPTALDYPVCQCSSDFTGYNCSKTVQEIESVPDNLLALWISVGVAATLLVFGLGACGIYIVAMRRRRQRHHSLLRRRRLPGPALFNPQSRVPVEAYNYQFATGTVRSDDFSDVSSGVSSRNTGPSGRAGSSVPFAPRFPRAYYSQLGRNN